MSQILRNFISNALKFTEAGEIRVMAGEGPGGFVTFRVSDTGIGIAPEDCERIFQEFSQVDHPLNARSRVRVWVCRFPKSWRNCWAVLSGLSAN